MLPLDHLNFHLDYQYSLGLASHKRLQLLFAADPKDRPCFSLLELNSLLSLQIPFGELLNKYSVPLF